MTTPDVAEALARAATELDAAPDLESTLQRIVEVAADSLPDIEHAGISLVSRQGIETRAATDQVVRDLDAAQYETGEGPCLDAMDPREPTVTIINDLRHEQRWPEYVKRALPLGLRAQLGVRLFRDGKTQGALNLYSLEQENIGHTTVDMAVLFAAHAAVAVGHASTEHHLNEALKSRRTIGQAIGIVSERYSLDEDRAFEYITRVSQHSNLKLYAVAEEIVRLRNLRGSEEPGTAGAGG